jgi:hypothetical protein
MTDLLGARLRWEKSRGAAAEARVEEQVEAVVKKLVIQRFGSLGVAAARAFEAARARS